MTTTWTAIALSEQSFFISPSVGLFHFYTILPKISCALQKVSSIYQTCILETLIRTVTKSYDSSVTNSKNLMTIVCPDGTVIKLRQSRLLGYSIGKLGDDIFPVRPEKFLDPHSVEKKQETTLILLVRPT